MDLEHMKTCEGELVTTGELREGDIIRNNGCLMHLGRFQELARRAGEPGHGHGNVRWSTGTVLLRFNDTIPMGYFDRDDTRTQLLWQVQGNNLATWLRVGHLSNAEG